MADYLHGVYGQVKTAGNRPADGSLSAIVYVGTAPVHTIALESGESYNVNKPVVVNNIQEARKAFGYSEDWASYSLCEAMYVHFEMNGVGPLVLINVLDPTKASHKSSSQTSVDLTPVNGVITMPNAGNVILDSVTVQTKDETPVTKEKGVDYSIEYDADRAQIVMRELTAGALGTAALAVKYYSVLPSGVTDADVIGSTDGLGLNTGLYALNNVYPLTGYIPAFLAAPGFSSHKAVHDVMATLSQKLNGHWDAYMFVDLPLINSGTVLTMDTVVTYKNANGYTLPNETVYWPMASGTDGKKYHLSVLAAANFQGLLIDQDGIPYRTASNTECAVIQKLYTSDSDAERVYDDTIINQKLNKNGIASAAYVGGRWAIWGAHSAEYDQTHGDTINISETNVMMLYYLSNDFQSRRNPDVDQPMTANDLMSIVSEEQSRLDALIQAGALTFGEVFLNATPDDLSDLMKGDFSFTFNVTTTPIAKSLTARVNWTDQGFVTYFEALTA